MKFDNYVTSDDPNIIRSHMRELRSSLMHWQAQQEKAQKLIDRYTDQIRMQETALKEIEQEQLSDFLCETFPPNSWEFLYTGGGCTAFIIEGGKDGEHWLITDGDASAPESINDAVTVGRYDGEGCNIDCFNVDCLKKITFDKETFTIKAS